MIDVKLQNLLKAFKFYFIKFSFTCFIWKLIFLNPITSDNLQIPIFHHHDTFFSEMYFKSISHKFFYGYFSLKNYSFLIFKND